MEWYEKQSQSNEVSIELIYHSIQSNQFDVASSILMDKGRHLISQGHMELLGLIELIDTDGLKKNTVVLLGQLQGDILALLGRLSEAEEILTKALEGAKKSKNSSIEAEILSSLADVSRKQQPVRLSR